MRPVATTSISTVAICHPLRSVRELAAELNRELGDGAAALVHNAGVLTARSRDERRRP